MALVIEFERKQRGGRRTSSKSDVYVSHVDAGDAGRPKSVSIRICKAVMEQLRWIVGDFVKAQCEVSDDGTTAVWSLRRVTGPDAGGCKLSGQGRDDGSASVRFTLPIEAIAQIFPGGAKGFDGEIIDSDGVTAKFKVLMS